MIEWVSVQERLPEVDDYYFVAYTIPYWPPQYALAKYARVRVRAWGEAEPSATVWRWQMDGHNDLDVTHWTDINEPKELVRRVRMDGTVDATYDQNGIPI